MEVQFQKELQSYRIELYIIDRGEMKWLIVQIRQQAILRDGVALCTIQSAALGEIIKERLAGDKFWEIWVCDSPTQAKK